MQDVNNDMDDLFKQAGEKYPLKTDGADWDKVLTGLNAADAPIAATAKAKPNRKKRVLWLLLLLPLSSLYFILHNFSETKNNASTPVKLSTQNKRTANQQSAANNTRQTTTVLVDNENSSKIKSDQPVKKFDNKSSETVRADMKPSLQKGSIIKQPSANHLFGNEAEKAASNSIYKSDEQNNESAIINNKNKVEGKQPDDVLARIHNTKVKQNKNDTAAQTTAHAPDATSTNKKDSSEAKTTEAKEVKKVVVKAKTQQQQGFYAGALASFDVSTIKFQRINKTGYSFDFLLGYQFSKHAAVELGVSWSQKNYYSTGKYFNIKKTGLPSDSKVVYTKGNCSMFEVPVGVMYNLQQNKKHSFFARAGLSSYFMKKESYDYRVYHGTNVQGAYNATRSYKNSGANWFSVADLSLGYQLRLNKTINLRIEPYLKMPLTGIGIAKLPITSTGISVGFTRPL